MRVLTALSLLFLGFGGTAFADARQPTVSLTGSVGFAQVDVDHFEPSFLYSLHLQYDVLPRLGIALGRHSFDGFEIRQRSTGSVAFDGLELSLSTSLFLDSGLVIQPRVGYLAYEAEARSLAGVWDEDGRTVTAGVSVRYPLRTSRLRLGVAGDLRRAFSVSDAAVDWLSVGVYLGF